MPRTRSRRLRPKNAIFFASLVGIGLVTEVVSARPESIVEAIASPSRPVEAAIATPIVARPTPHLPATFRVGDAIRQGERLVARLEGGDTAELTIDPELQSHLERELARYEVPLGAAVAIEPSTGRVLAYVSHANEPTSGVDLARGIDAPSASVFKIVTAAALVEHGVTPSTEVCFGGGLHGISAVDLVDDPGRDRSCATLAEALGGSINAVFAKLSDRRLDRAILDRYAHAFGYGEALPFDLPTVASPIDIPDDRLERARASAGFWHSRLSPLHAALLAATIANGGVMPHASLVSRVVDPSGTVRQSERAPVLRRVIGADTARIVGQMMERTVHGGTAHSAFFDEHGNPFLPGVRVAGKTGTLNRDRPEFRGYTWFVGYAPAERPTIAIATLVVNRPEWRIKASYLAREGLRVYLASQMREAVTSTPRAPSRP